MTEQPATLERMDGIGVITLRRPTALNAVNAALSQAVGDALEEVDNDPSLSLAILTGTGRAFCVGADLKAVAAGEDIAAPRNPEWGFAGVTQHVVAKPVIAAVNGFALGGGTELVLACDLAVMSAEATLGLPEAKHGLFAAAGGVIRLPRQIPMKLAMEVALTAEPIDAETALRLGLVNRVVPAGDTLEAALELGRRIAANAPLALRISKLMARRAVGERSQWDDDVWTLNEEQIARVLASADHLEGAKAFAEKRTPKWTGA